MKGTVDRKDWILDFRDDHCDVLGIRYASSLNYNGCFWKSMEDSKIYATVYLRRFYEEIVGEMRNLMLIVKDGMFYEILTDLEVPALQLFWETLFHILRDSPIIISYCEGILLCM